MLKIRNRWPQYIIEGRALPNRPPQYQLAWGGHGGRFSKSKCARTKPVAWAHHERGAPDEFQKHSAAQLPFVLCALLPLRNVPQRALRIPNRCDDARSCTNGVAFSSSGQKVKVTPVATALVSTVKINIEFNPVPGCRWRPFPN